MLRKDTQLPTCSLLLHALPSLPGLFLLAAVRAVDLAVHQLQPQCLSPQPLYRQLRILNSNQQLYLTALQSKKMKPKPQAGQGHHLLLSASQTPSSTSSHTVSHTPNHIYQHFIQAFYPRTFQCIAPELTSPALKNHSFK